MAEGNLTRRLAVAVVGIPLVVGLLYLGGWFLGVGAAALAALGAAEVADLAEAGGVRPFRGLAMAGSAALVLVAAALPGFAGVAPWALAGLGALTAASLLLALWLRGASGRPLAAASLTLFGVVYIGMPLALVMLLHRMPEAMGWTGGSFAPWGGALVVMLPLGTTWAGDSAAYFFGMAFGRRKIAPSISPAKSWVGAAAGLVASTGTALGWWAIARGVLPGMPLTPGAAAAVGAVIGAGGQCGDFVESLLKREAGVKDSGTIFPGHGGVLDRLDALIFAFPIAYALLVLGEVLA